jgi:serine phosphatase RsbU (regulator of sigma subunit)/Tfp pilus assembly protein PilF
MKPPFKNILLPLLLVLLFADTSAQSVIDSIERKIPSLTQHQQVSAYIDLAYEHYAIGGLDAAQENANRALILSEKHNNLKEKANAFTILSHIALSKGATNTSITNASKALEIGEQTENPAIMANAYKSLGVAYYQKSEYQKALKNFENSLLNFEKLDDKNESAEILYNIGVIYKNWGEYYDAIEYYEKALRIFAQLGSDMWVASIYGNLGNIYFYSGIDYENALQNYQKALELFREKELRNYEANMLINIGLVEEKRGNFATALEFYNNGLEISEQINDNYSKGQALSNIGNIYLIREDYDKALEQLNNALEIFESLESKKDIALILKSIGNLYHLWDKHIQAKDFYLKSIALCEELDLRKELSDNYKELAYVYTELNDYKAAFGYFEQYAQQNDSIFSAEYKDLITEWNARLETAEKEAALIEQKNEIRAKEAQIKRKNMIMYAFVFGILIVLIFSSLLYKQYREKQKANILLQEQNDEIKHQRDKIFEQNKEITDSIEYASKIQSAILPPDEYISSILPDHFILFRPRDIVSGDFYWINKYKNKIFLCAADCTGHGVPGAFMSMLGIALLNEIINKKNEFTAAEILNNLRSQVVNSMHQRGYDGETQDGMDIAFCIIDTENKTIDFSGAFNPLFIIRDCELIEYKADKMPIGVHLKQEVPFSNHIINYQPGDQLYVFSDGYADQFGGPKRKKFLIKRFKELLIEKSGKNMADQKTALQSTIDEWMGPHDQIDDILVIGAKLN